MLDEIIVFIILLFEFCVIVCNCSKLRPNMRLKRRRGSWPGCWRRGRRKWKTSQVCSAALTRVPSALHYILSFNEISVCAEDVKRLNEKLADTSKVKMDLQFKLDNIQSSEASVQVSSTLQ